MEKLKKIYWLSVRRVVGYYPKAEIALFDLRFVQIIPNWIYSPLFKTAMAMNEFKYFRKSANWLIHRVPLHVRFAMA